MRPPRRAVLVLAALLAGGCLAGSGQDPVPIRGLVDSLGVAPDAGQATTQAPPLDVPSHAPAPWTPVLGPPQRGADGRLVWAAEQELVESEAAKVLARFAAMAEDRDSLTETARGAAQRDSAARSDSLRAWALVSEHSRLAPYAWYHVMRLHARNGAAGEVQDVLQKFWRSANPPRSDDSLQMRMKSIERLWHWDAVRIALARPGFGAATERADSILEATDTRAWPEGHRAEWLIERAERRLAIGDSSAAIAMSRRVLLVGGSYESRTAALQLLEAQRHERAEPLRPDESYAAADLALRPEEGPPDLAAAEQRLHAVFRDDTTALELRAGMRLGETQRRRRRYNESLRTFARTLRLAASVDDSARSWLGKARTERNARRRTSARASYARVIRSRASLPLREDAWWELGRMAEDQSSWRSARAAYDQLVQLGGERREAAALRGGLIELAEGHRDSALAWFARGADSGARFWRGVLLRERGAAAGDSLLREIAAEPGYDFYSVAARETLGVRGWPGEVLVRDACPGGVLCEPLELARDLAALGAHEDARRVLDRWAEIIREHASRIDRNERSHAFLHAARVAYAAGVVGPATLYAAQAAWAAPTPERSWQMRPWRYPPAHDSLFAALPDSADEDGIERALMQGLAWQESKFDARARSRANARGIVQLMMPTAADVARWLHEPRPDEEDLFEPARNLRLGVRYMRYLLRRFDHNVPVALAAYNGGPGRIARHWRELRKRGGDALICEMVSVTASNDYAKRVLSLRQAYREMRPTTASP